MSTSLHQYPPRLSLLHTPNVVDPQQHDGLIAQRTGPSQTITLQYEALQFHRSPHVTLSSNAVGKPHRLPYTNGPLAATPRTRGTMLHERSGRTSGPVRRRISRACDQCNQLRTKCDGQKPCSHCIEFGLTCAYLRERKKRGKASRKELARQQAAAAASSDKGAQPSEKSAITTPKSQGTASERAQNASPTTPEEKSSFPVPSVPSRSASLATTRVRKPAQIYSGRTMSMSAVDSITGDIMPTTNDGLQPPPPPPRIQTHGLNHHDYASMHDFHQNIAYQPPHAMIHPTLPSNVPSNDHPLDYTGHPPITFMGQSLPDDAPHLDFVAHSPVSGSPTWMLPSPSTTLYSGGTRPKSSLLLRYPVLEPVVPYLTDIMPFSLACDLLELYFDSTSSVYLQPVSPYVLGHVFRKSSFLRRDNPRICSPALLASMLWIGSLTSESPYLTSSPLARSQISEKLINLTIGLLKPLVHQTPSAFDADPAMYNNSGMVHGVTMGGFGMPPQVSEEGIGLDMHFGNLDDVATYVNLGVVTSASEYKAASLRWWNAAWSLAREMRLGKEIVTPPPDLYDEATGNFSGRNTTPEVTEEQREERRRMWWLLYTMDRHLALCYNRPLSFTDVECAGLLQPFDDHVWQSGDFFEDSAQSLSDPAFRRRGPAFECTGHSSIFEFFLPLMTILGEIVDLTHARNHPRFGAKTDWDEYGAEISQRLDAYGRSLQGLQQRVVVENDADTLDSAPPDTPSVRSSGASSSRVQESLMHARIAATYGTYLMHTLHVLLNGKWDPISLLDDNDLWISSQSFVTATGHAVSAAEALNEILELDPDLSFMPFFFGIYLLQGSFLLLLIADKLQGEANPNIVRACEVIVRAHEACIVTLNTEYQRNFRNIMLSALQQMRGRGMQASVERRREILSLYRWGDGTGLAL